MSQTGLPPSAPQWDAPWPPPAPSTPPPPVKPLSKAAVASVVFGVIGGSILGIIFGLVGVSNTGKLDDRRGRGLAWTGLALSVVWLVATVAVVALAVAGQADRAPDGTVQRAGTSSFLDLQKGDCLQDPVTNGTETEVKSVDVTPCTQPHDAQVFAVVQPTTATFDRAAVQAEVEQLCTTAAQSAITVTERFDLVYFYPQQQEWDGGDHTSVCVLSSSSTLTSSVVAP